MPRQQISKTELNRLAIRGAKVTRRSSPVPSAAEVVASESPAPVQPRPESASPSSPIPMASMAASMTAINKQLGDIVEHNTRVIEGFQADLQRQMLQRPKRTPWRATVVRDQRTRLIEHVDLVPQEG